MLLDTLPVHAPITHAATGDERQIAAVLLLMNDPADDGLTTGWYWTAVPRNPEPEDLKSKRRWREAVGNRQGPFRDANTAFAAAENHTPEGAALAARLEQAAALLAAGEIDASPAAVSAWLQAAGNEDRRNGRSALSPVGPDPEAKPPRNDRAELDEILKTGTVPDDNEGGEVSDDDQLTTRGADAVETGATTASEDR